MRLRRHAACGAELSLEAPTGCLLLHATGEPSTTAPPQAKLRDLKKAAVDAGERGLALPLAAVTTGALGGPCGRPAPLPREPGWGALSGPRLPVPLSESCDLPPQSTLHTS